MDLTEAKVIAKSMGFKWVSVDGDGTIFMSMEKPTWNKHYYSIRGRYAPITASKYTGLVGCKDAVVEVN